MRCPDGPLVGEVWTVSEREHWVRVAYRDPPATTYGPWTRVRGDHERAMAHARAAVIAYAVRQWERAAWYALAAERFGTAAAAAAERWPSPPLPPVAPELLLNARRTVVVGAVDPVRRRPGAGDGATGKADR